MTEQPDASRRSFLINSALTATAVGLATGGVHAAGEGVLRVGLVGCGGRGTGAAKDALLADPNVKLVALGDVFDDRLQSSLKQLKSIKSIAGKVDLKPEMCFTGFDAYKSVIENCDVILLCTPPAFRPVHVRAAIEAGKHTFCEKPIAVDAVGVRSIIESAAMARKKNVSLMTGYCFRYDLGMRETVKRIHDGMIGDIQAIHCNYITGQLWHKGNDPKWSPMEQQMRNWYYYSWLSGDHIVEQHCHNHDKALWLLEGKLPVAAWGTGGRQQRVDAMWGNIYDHHAVVYEFPGNVKVFSYCRQQAGCYNNVSDHVIGAKGQAQIMDYTIKAGEAKWVWKGEMPTMYQQEHNELFAGIRKGELINNAVAGAYSSLMSIMGRMATYTGQRITWEQALASQESLVPEKLAWGPAPAAPIAIPGKTKFI